MQGVILFSINRNSSLSRPIALVLLALAATTVGSGELSAQTTSEPESYRNIDEFGVDLSSGSFNFSMEQAAGGSASTGIDVTRTWGKAGWKDANVGHLRRDGSVITVVRGSTSEVFNLSGGNWSSAKGDGATLVQAVVGPAGRFPLFEYTGSDGTKIVYRSVVENIFTPTDDLPDNYKIHGPAGACRTTQMEQPIVARDRCMVPVSITSPSSERIDLTWQEESDCEEGSGRIGRSYDCIARYRLIEISDQSGYTVSYHYQSWFYNYTNGWWKRAKAVLKNRGTGEVVEANYSGTAGNEQIIDSDGGVWTFTYDAADKMTSISRPGASSPNVTIAYGSDLRVASVTMDGVTRTYHWTINGQDLIVSYSGGSGGSGTVTTSLVSGRPTAITNAMNNSVRNQYDTNGRLTRTTWPEGNYVQYTRDARGNATQTTYVPKGGSGAGSIVTFANFPASCSNPVTCVPRQHQWHRFEVVI